ncbi:MAG TPA: hypothetical protein VF198_04200 [Vicinamibacterales bacterium]
MIRLLPQELASRKVEVAINPGSEQNASVGSGRKDYPDALIYSTDKGRRLIGVIEVETGESVNNLEATWQWAQLARLKVPFHLYVPMSAVDVARRLSVANQIPVAEIWSYHQVGDQMKFTLIHRDAEAAALPPAPPERPARRPAAKSPRQGAAKAARRAAAAPKRPAPAATKRTAGGRTAKAAARNGSAARGSKGTKAAGPARRPAAAAKPAKKTAKAAPRRAAAKPAARRSTKAGSRRSVRSAKRSSK